MHELSIATAILERVELEASKRPGIRVTKVGVRVGELSGVDPDALSFGFEALVKDTVLDPLALDIELCARKQRCPACGTTFFVKDYDVVCPQCREPATECVSGNELDIAYLEVAEE